MERGMIIVGLVFIFSLNLVLASDVAYVSEGRLLVDQNILNVFSDKGLDVEFIECEDVEATDFSEYKFIFIGNYWLGCGESIPISEYPSLILNNKNGKDFGLVKKSMPIISSRRLLKISNEEIIDTYTKKRYNKRSITTYYISERDLENFEKIADIYIDDDLELGSAIVNINPNSPLHNGKIANAKISFFGATDSRFWTEETEELFEDCIDFLLDEEVLEEPGITCNLNSDCGDDEFVGGNYCSGDDVVINYIEYTCNNPGTEESFCSDETSQQVVDACEFGCEEGVCIGAPEGVHDVGVSNLKLTGGVSQIPQGESTRVYIDVENFGEFDEDVTFEGKIKRGGEIIQTFNHNPILPLFSGEQKNNKYKSVTFDMDVGFYDLSVEAIIYQDDVPENNLVEMQIEVI